ncbi:MAG TPA: hypothetical protein VFD92_06200 [Candidatus Binatia bacterium]|nr:hypothetical protein [Candidatus Binatia bacterium]
MSRTPRLAAALLAVTLCSRAFPAAADPVRDTLPFRIVHGRPQFTSGDETAVYFWFQGGRLRLRVTADAERSHKVEGELRTSNAGAFEDVTPLSENLRIRQPRPGKLLFDVRTRDAEEGFDVTLAGDYNQVTVDLLVDGERRPGVFRIGENKRSPSGLPARLDLRNADSSWIERFGF